MLLINRKLRNQGRGVVHTQFSLDTQPIDAFGALVAALTVTPREKPVQTPPKRILRDVYEAEVDRLAAERAPAPARELNHRQKSELARIQREAEPEQLAFQEECRARAMGEEVDATQIRDFYVKPERQWRTPSEKTVRKARPSHGGPRQETKIKRQKLWQTI